LDVVETFFIGEQLGDKIPEEDFIQGSKRVPIVQSHIVIGPKVVTESGPEFLDESYIFGVELGDKFQNFLSPHHHERKDVYLWGWVAYRDIFPSTKRHLTEYCEHLGQAGLIPNFNGQEAHIVFDFTNCPYGEHNCTDETCPDYNEVMGFLAEK
jgi:hypothetical protein